MIEPTPEISTQRINLILKTVFELLWFEPQGLYVSEIVKYLKNSIPFTDYETGYFAFSPYLPRYEVIMRVGTIPLVKAGWLEKTKNGRWFITNNGRNACYKYKGSEDFFRASIELLQEWKLQENKRLAYFDSDPYNNAQEFASDQIRQYLEILDIKEIRIIVSSLLKALGCYITWNVSNMDDNNPFDMICSLDPLGLKPPRLIVFIGNCSEKASSISIDLFSKRLEPNDIGIFFSFGGFVNGAEEFAIESTHPAIRLINLEKFIDLWVNNLGKIDHVGLSKLPLRPIHFLGIPGHHQNSEM